MKPRDIALEALNKSDKSPGSRERHLDGAFRKNSELDERDRAFAVHLVQGTLRWRGRLDWIIEQNIDFPLRKLEPLTLNILRLALYQIFYLDRVPDSAAVNEAVKQARALARRHIPGVVNAVLRGICRKKRGSGMPEPGGDDSVGRLSIIHAYPRWLVKKWMKELGAETGELLAAGNLLPRLDIRTNILKTDREALLRRLRDEGLSCMPAPRSPQGIIINGSAGTLEKMDSFQGGFFQVQGEAAQIASHLLSPKKGHRVLDAGAGLGGKASHLAEIMGPGGVVVALDINHARLNLLSGTMKRLGIDVTVHPVLADAAGDLSRLFRGKFDRIVVDAPCSALGTISRHPDVKWTKNESDPERLARVQGDMLNNVAPLLRKGGRMLYVTCTISREENEEVVEYFLKTHEDFAFRDLNREIPEWGRDMVDHNGFFRTYPHRHNMDGFFGALFERA